MTASAALKALLLALDEAVPGATWQEAGRKLVFLRAQYGATLAPIPTIHEWLLEQSFAPYANRLREGGFTVQPQLEIAAQSADAVLYLATRFAEEVQSELARSWEMLKPGGWLVTAGHNDLGGKRLEKLLKQLPGDPQSISKYHCRAVAIRKSEAVPDEAVRARLAQWQRAGMPHTVPGTPLQAVPGMFSWRKVDRGSELLAQHLPSRLAGRGADIASGWGYLSHAILTRCEGVTSITLYEAEKRALDMAAQNLQSAPLPMEYIWADAARPLESDAPFDWAVMNPPAHDLTKSTPDVSVAILVSAACALKKGGSLWLVANRHLPYEHTLAEYFTSFRKVAETGEFKVIEAVR